MNLYWLLRLKKGGLHFDQHVNEQSGKAQLLECSHNLQLLACNKVPCELESFSAKTEIGGKEVDYLDYQLNSSESDFTKNMFFEYEGEFYILALDDMIQHAFRNVTTERDSAKRYLEVQKNGDGNWPTPDTVLMPTFIREDLKKLISYYNYHNQFAKMCEGNKTRSTAGEK